MCRSRRRECADESCHERWDGGGYPDGLSGEDIPLVARIVACCDAYNAMTTDRPYRAALPESEALAEVDGMPAASSTPPWSRPSSASSAAPRSQRAPGRNPR